MTFNPKLQSKKKIVAPMLGGKELDNYGKLFGMKRRRYFFFFKESDKKYRARLLQLIRDVVK